MVSTIIFDIQISSPFCEQHSFFLVFIVAKVTENDYQIGMCIALCVFCHFPIWRFGSVVKLDCINL